MAKVKNLFWFYSILALVLTATSNVLACTNPSGVEGEIIFFENYNVPAYCDNINWIAMTGGDPLTGSGDYIPNAVEFDDTTPDYLTLAGGLTGVSDSKIMTGSFWYRTDTVKDQQPVQDPTDGPYIFSNGNLRFNAFNPSVSQILRADISGTNLNDGNWHHILYSFDLSNPTNRHVYVNDIVQSLTIGIYIDDFIDHTDAIYSISEQWAPTRLSADIADYWFDTDQYIDFSIEANRREFIDASGNPVFLGSNGTLPTGTAPDIFLSGDTATWHTNKGTGGGFTENGALTDAATTPYVPRTKIVPSGLVGHWRFDENSGIVAFDSSGNNNDGALGGDYSWETDGVVSGNINFAGAGGRVEVTQNTIINDLSEVTFSAWVKGVSGGGAYLTQKRQDFSIFGSNTNDWLQFTADWDGSIGQWRTPNNVLNDDIWHHVAITYDFSSTTNDPIFYIDGIPIANGSLAMDNNPTGSPETSSANLIIGNRSSFSNDWQNDIDDVRLYNRTLTPNEITEIYAARDGIRYNKSQRIPEYFDGNQFVALTADWAAPDKNTPIYSPTLVTGCPNIGDSCSDGSLYAGDAPDTGVRFFITDVNQGTNIQWNTANGNDDIAVSEDDNGALNHASLNVAFTVLPAINTCETLSLHGHTDWYLPAPNELLEIYTNRAAINTNATDAFSNGGGFWSSREVANNTANRIDGSGNIQTNQKIQDYGVRCVRREPLTITGTGSLVGHWKLDKTSGTTAVDSSGNGNDGAMQNDMDADNDSTSGAVATSLSFDGVDDKINISDPGADSIFDFDNGDQITISAWATSFNTDTWSHIVAKGASGSNITNWAMFTHNDRAAFAYRNAANDQWHNYRTTAVSFPDESWQHIVVTYTFGTGSSIKIFVNGVEEAGSWFTGNGDDAPNINNNNVNIGRLLNGDLPWNGNIDDVRIYDRALSAAEITQLYQMGTPAGSSTALPQGCPNIGDVCDDGTIYAGLSPDGNVEMFTATDDAPTTLAWDDGTSGNNVATSLTDETDGDGNTATLVLIDSDDVSPNFQYHNAAQYCYDLVDHGANDWYLPARQEAALFVSANGSLANILTSSDHYITSTERIDNANRYLSVRIDSPISLNTNTSQEKHNDNNIRCVRKGPAPRCANPYGLEGQMLYNTDYDVVQYCDGARWVAIGKYSP